MDGFYVAKIQKLSDRRPDDHEKESKVATEGGDINAKEKSVESVSKDDNFEDDPEIDWAAQVKKAAFSEDRAKDGKVSYMTEVNVGGSSMKHAKKRNGVVTNHHSSKKQKSKAVSIPPIANNKSQKTKQLTRSAKLTKPRRQKQQASTN